MNSQELEKFLDFYGLTNNQFAQIIGVTPEAVKHWLVGRRAIPATAVKCILFFKAHPEMMTEFERISV